MKPLRFFPFALGLCLSLLFSIGLQNCKKSTPDPVTPGTTNPGSTTTTPGTSTTAATSTAPTVSTASAPLASGIASTSATVSATINGNGGAAISQHGFVYSKTVQLPTVSDSKTEQGATTGPFPLTINSKLTGLEANTSYYVRAFATNGKGTGYGAVAQVKTSTATSTSVTVSLVTQQQDIFGVTGTTIGMRTFLFAPEGTAVSQYGHVWTTVTNQNPTTADKKTELGPATVGNMFLTFTGSITGLIGSTKYNVRAYAIVNGRTYYADQTWTITTLEQVVSTVTITAKASFPAKVDYTKSFVYEMNGKAYVSAGSAYDDKIKNNRTDFYEYDPATDKWTLKAGLPADFSDAAYGSVAFVHKNKWYYGFGGSTGIAPPFNYRSLWEYDPATDKWAKKYEYTTRPFDNSYNTASVYLDGMVYILGEKKFTVFDVEKNTFTDGPAFPVAYGSGYIPLLTVLNGKLYGLTRDANSRLFEYDPATNKWTEKANGRAAMKYTTYVFGVLMPINGKLYAANAWGAAEYDPAMNIWKKVLDNTTLNDALDGKTYFTSGNRAFLGLKSQKNTWVEFKP